MIGPASGLSALVADVDLLLVDVWGVLHDGAAAHAGAIDALARFRAGGGFVVLVSNAPRAGAAVVSFLDRLRIPRAAYDAIVTSGDVTRALLAEGRWRSLAYVGPERDRALFADLGLSDVPVMEADVLLCAGLVDDERETADDHAALLTEALARRLVMICANPDLAVRRAGRLVPCAGALAARYAARGGEVAFAGKPHRAIYDAAFDIAALSRGEAVDPARALAIGDAPRTDIAGAREVGARSLLIADGLHAADMLDASRAIDGAKLAAFLEGQARPDAVMTRLVW